MSTKLVTGSHLDAGQLEIASEVERGFATKGMTLLLLGLVFCVSGVSALLYQVAWQRILVLHSGVGMYSVAMIVAAFLAGLGIGSYWGGVLSKRTSQLTALRIFACLELGVGVFALLSPYLFYELLYQQYPFLFANIWSAGFLHFLLLLVPTTMMGMSLPFITRGTVFNPTTASQTIGYLYGINVLGAALGALLAPWVFIRLFGIDGAIYIGAMGNLFAGVVTLVLGSRIVPVEQVHHVVGIDVQPPVGVEDPKSHAFSLWMALYTMSGFVAVSLEIIWFRLIDVAVKASAFTFGTVLAIFLLGLGIGSLAGGSLALRMRRPLRMFLLFQCVLLIYSGLAVSALVFFPPEWPLYSKLVAYWFDAEGLPLGPNAFAAHPRLMLTLYGVLPCFLYGIPTLLMGLCFGILQRAVHDDPKSSGFKVGILQAGNIIGNVAGSLVAGLLLLNFLGTAVALKCMIAIGLIFAAIGIFFYGGRWVFSVAACTLMLLLFVMPSGSELWHRLHGLTDVQAMVREDAVAVVAMAPKDNESYRMTVNGKSHSYLPYGGIATLLGSGPALIHPSPQDVAVIGLGSGNTAWATACRQETQKVTVYEIAAMEKVLLDDLAAAPPSTNLRRLYHLLEDPRVNIIAADGRNALALDNKKYDLIEVDVLRPWTAYSGNLYSVEFYSLLASKLKKGGIVRSWALGERNRQAFRSVFRYYIELKPGRVLGWGFDATALIGSNEPITLDTETWLARLADPHVQEYLGGEIVQQVTELIHTAQLPSPIPDPGLLPNRDLFPRDEFRTPKHR